MRLLRRGRDQARARREKLEVRLATGQSRLERARESSLAVDTAVGMLRRQRPVAVGILAAALAFRLFALLIPLTYLLVAGLGFAGSSSGGRPDRGDRLGDLIVGSIATVAGGSNRGRWLAVLVGGVATLLAAAGVVEVLRWVHMLAWQLTPVRDRRGLWQVLGLVGGIVVVFGASVAAEQARAAVTGLGGELTVLLAAAAGQAVLLAGLWLALSWALPRPATPWIALVPGSLLFAGGFLLFSLTVRLYFVPRAARASAVYGSLGVALVLLVSLFLFGRLAVAAAELNATLWERRQAARRSADR
jgi:uncharacterized BrkB/YihY/UPF0761 family membrane protein